MQMQAQQSDESPLPLVQRWTLYGNAMHIANTETNTTLLGELQKS